MKVLLALRCAVTSRERSSQSATLREIKRKTDNYHRRKTGQNPAYQTSQKSPNGDFLVGRIYAMLELMVVHKLAEKAEAIALRKQGLSYNEILRRVPVAKSTLSLWLRSVKLARSQKQRLTSKRSAAQKLAVQAIKQKRIGRTLMIKNAAITEVPVLINNPLWLTGVILYWAEGSKNKPWSVSNLVQFTNMDVEMIKIFIKWCEKYLKTNNQDIIYELYIHKGTNLSRSLEYWSKALRAPARSFRVYYKSSNTSTKRKNTREGYFGTIKVRLRKSVDANRRIEGWVEGVVEYYSYSRIV